MALSYVVFTDAFLAKVSEFDFGEMDQFTRTMTVDNYMKRACAQFDKICKYDLSTRDDVLREFAETIPEEDIVEIADIVSEGMLVYWMKPFVYRQENLEQNLNTKDFTSYSPAELLYRIRGAYTSAQKDFVGMQREYSYRHGDLTDLHL